MPQTGRVRRTIRRWVLAVAAVALLAGGLPLGAAVLISPAQIDHGWISRLPPCPARTAGGSCALCGMSHAMSAMARGHFAEAARANPRGPGLFLACLALSGLGAAGVTGAGLAGRRERGAKKEEGVRHQ